MKLISTSDYRVRGMKGLGYGESGIGKTTLAGTLPNPIIISAEQGLLSLSHLDIPVIEVTSFDALTNAYKWIVSSKEAEVFESIAIDSISDLSEVLLAEFKKKFKDPRQAYGQMNDEIGEAVRRFRDIKNKHVYMIAKIKRQEDELSGAVTYVPNVPGKQMLQNLPYFFDLVFVMKYGKDKDGKKIRQLQTEGDRQFVAKDRSNKLDKFELPDLTAVINKMKGD